jgi:hypothetical protein
MRGQIVLHDLCPMWLGMIPNNQQQTRDMSSEVFQRHDHFCAAYGLQEMTFVDAAIIREKK